VQQKDALAATVEARLKQAWARSSVKLTGAEANPKVAAN
jgi:hypothetical protein